MGPLIMSGGIFHPIHRMGFLRFFANVVLTDFRGIIRMPKNPNHPQENWALKIAKMIKVKNVHQVANAIGGAACGAGGQRCMAISVGVFVGKARNMIPKVTDKPQYISC